MALTQAILDTSTAWRTVAVISRFRREEGLPQIHHKFSAVVDFMVGIDASTRAYDSDPHD